MNVLTWGELKLVTLQKMFAVTGDDIVIDDTTSPYLKSMPAAANEALLLLSTAGRMMMMKKFEIAVERAEDAETGGGSALVVDASSAGNGGRVVARAGDGVSAIKVDFSGVSDFYAFDEDEIYFDDGDRYGKAAVRFEGENTLILDADKTGVYTVFYNAYPKAVGKNTPDDFELSLHPEVAAAAPLYMASQLYKDDNVSLAAQYRNEFEAAREAMLFYGASRARGGGRFYSATGWW